MARCDYIEDVDKINQGRHIFYNKYIRVTWKFIVSTRRFWKLLTQAIQGAILLIPLHWSLLHAVPHFFCSKGLKDSVFFVLPKNRCFKLCEKVLQISKCKIFSESAVPSRSRKPSNKVVQKWPICPPRNWERWAELSIRIFLLFNNLPLLFSFCLSFLVNYV